MNTKLSALLTTAIVTGLLATQVAKAEDSAPKSNDHMAAEKNGCKGMKDDDKNSCKSMKADDKNSCKGTKDAKKKKKADKNSCKNGCGEAKTQQEEGK